MATVHAEVNHDRWIVQCAACNSATECSKLPKPDRYECEEPGCGAVYDVAWPADPDAIMAVLALRPDRSTRSWVHSEDVAALVGENIAHGVA